MTSRFFYGTLEVVDAGKKKKEKFELYCLLFQDSEKISWKMNDYKRINKTQIYCRHLYMLFLIFKKMKLIQKLAIG